MTSFVVVGQIINLYFILRKVFQLLRRYNSLDTIKLYADISVQNKNVPKNGLAPWVGLRFYHGQIYAFFENAHTADLKNHINIL